MKERGAIEILEEAVGLLRTAPAAAIAAYLAGAIPFSLGILFFWADMARNPFAFERLPWESLGMAGLLVWKSVWQAIFQALLYRQLSLSQPRSMRIARLVAMQCALQPFSLLAIPVSLLLTIPFAWTVAFFRNARPRSTPVPRGTASGWTLDPAELVSAESDELGGAASIRQYIDLADAAAAIGKEFPGY